MLRETSTGNQYDSPTKQAALNAAETDRQETLKALNLRQNECIYPILHSGRGIAVVSGSGIL